MSLEVKNLYKKYLRSKQGFTVENLSFEIKKGEIFALVGQNGAGKSTTIKCILDFLRYKKGTITYNEMNISSAMNQNKVGYMPENLIYPRMTTLNKYLKDITVLREINNSDSINEINKLIKIFSLDKHTNKNLSDFSKGMRQKVGFIQAVFFKPELLILDEPTDGLDPVARRTMLNYIKELSHQGTSVLITSHILADLEHICDEVALMKDGTIIAKTTVREILDAESTEKLSLEDWYFNVLKSKEDNDGEGI